MTPIRRAKGRRKVEDENIKREDEQDELELMTPIRRARGRRKVEDEKIQRGRTGRTGVNDTH